MSKWRTWPGKYGYRLRAGVPVLVGAILLASCGSSTGSSASTSTTQAGSTTSEAKSPYVFHAVLSLTGSGATLGSIAKQALTAFANNINSQGGIDGHSVSLDIVDNQSSPSTAVATATSWIHSGVPFFLNGSISPVDNAVDALAGSQGPLIYDLSPVANPKSGSYVFATGISATYLEGAIANFMKASGYTRIAIMNSLDTSGLAGYNDLEDALKAPSAAGISVVSHQTYEPSSLSVTAQMSVIKAANPQALFVSTTGTPFGTVLKAMHSLGMENIPTFATSGNALQSELSAFTSILPTHLYLPLGPLYFSPSSLPAAMRPFMTSFDSVISAAGGQPNTGWGLPVDAFLLLVRALRSIGVNATASQLKDYLQSQVHNVPESFGLYNISEADHVGTDGNDVWMGQWNGKSFTVVSGADGESPIGKS
ncbi:MAG: hypothetical protein EPN30_10430 [Actinomycetota bacterium]|nr:MAG: hypothetical protein EPN30_10430 [Actinomycetota bacterium]